MKRIFAAILFLSVALSTVAQNPIRGYQVWLYNNTDSTLRANTGQIRFDPVTGKFRFGNGVSWTTYGSGSSVPGLTPIGTSLQQIRVNFAATALEYFTPLFNPATTNGDLIYFNGTTFTRIGIGSSGTVLSSNGTLPSWTTPSGISNTAANNEIPKSDGTNLLPSGLFNPSSGALRPAVAVGSSLSLRGYTSTALVPNGGLAELAATPAFSGGGGNGGSLSLTSGLGDGAGTPGGIFIDPANGTVFFGVEGEQGTSNIALQVPNGGSGAEDGSDFSAIAGTARQDAGNGSGGDIRLQTGTRRVAGSGIDGSVILETSNGNGTIKLNSGANEQMGLATLVAGTVTVNNTKVTANSFIWPVHRTTGGTIGILTYTIVAGTSFTITSSSALDTSTVNWIIIEPN